MLRITTPNYCSRAALPGPQEFPGHRPATMEDMGAPVERIITA
jgi:hypothetical protein